jgi:hypothetical protein
MAFLDTEVNLELVDADGRLRAASWPIPRVAGDA